MDYNHNRRYFENSKVPMYISIGLGVFGLLLFAGGEVGVILGLLFIAGGGAVFYFLDYKKRISDEELDRICESQIRDLKTEALNKLGIDEDEVNEAGHFQVSCYDYDARGTLNKKGKDGVWRSSQYKTDIFFFSRDVAHCFTRSFSIIKNEQRDSTEEYFYRDIVSVKVAENERKDQVCGEYVELTTTAGTVFKFAFRKSEADKVSRSINGMRNLLKDKKQTMA